MRDLKAELLGTKARTTLKGDAEPTIFSHQPPPKNPSLSSEKRSLEKARQEVRVIGVTNDKKTPCYQHANDRCILNLV